MVKGKTYKYLTPDFILSHISEYDIYRFYLGRGFRVNEPIQSPFRQDPVPSFLIGNKNGYLYHIDFGDNMYRGDCFDFVQQLMGQDLPGALHDVASNFGITSSGTGSRRVAPKYKQPKIIKQRPTKIQVISKRFTNDDLTYWNGYKQTEEDLKREKIYSVKSLYINKKKVFIPKDEIVFGYLFEDKYWKIYRPYSKDKKDKWRSNVPIDIMDGLENIKDCDKAIVTKSKKDKMVLLKVFPNVCATQNESLVALNDLTIKYLIQNTKEVYIAFDADEPGKKNSWEVTKKFGFKHVNVPDYFVDNGWKDWADVTKKFGLRAIEDHLKLKKII